MKRPTTLILASVLLVWFAAEAQSDFVPVKKWKVKEADRILVDRLGNFFILQKDGKLKKYDADGKALASLSKISSRSIEPWYHPVIFIYRFTRREYTLYDRNLKNGTVHPVDPAVAIEPFLVCPTHDNKIWVLDKADWSAKKINPLTNEVLLEFSIDKADFNDFIQIREYLNLLILLDKKSGILILNHMGKLIETIPVENLNSVYFFGEDLYYLQNNTLRFFNLVSEVRREIQLPSTCSHAVLTDERLLTIDANGKVTLYSYIPAPE